MADEAVVLSLMMRNAGVACALIPRFGCLSLVALVVFVIAGYIFWIPLHVAPASAYLLLADLPGAPVTPIASLLGQPNLREWQFVGVEGQIVADVYIPRSPGRHPTFLIVNGALSEGRKYGPLADFGAALARSGYTAVIPDYPDLLREELTPASLGDVEWTLLHLGDIPGADPQRVVLVGFCVGGVLSLLAVEDPNMPPVRAVVDLAGYYSTQDMIQLITTDTYTLNGALHSYNTDPWVVAAVARSLVSGLPNARDRAIFAPFVVDPSPTHYVAPDWSKVPVSHLSPGGQALLALLQNRDPSRVAALIAQLSPPLPQDLQALSPETAIARLNTSVYVVADRDDTYIPNAETLDLQQARPKEVHVSYVSLLAHVEPELQARSNFFATVGDTATGAWQLFRAIDQALTVVQ